MVHIHGFNLMVHQTWSWYQWDNVIWVFISIAVDLILCLKSFSLKLNISNLKNMTLMRALNGCWNDFHWNSLNDNEVCWSDSYFQWNYDNLIFLLPSECKAKTSIFSDKFEFDWFNTMIPIDSEIHCSILMSVEIATDRGTFPSQDWTIISAYLMFQALTVGFTLILFMMGRSKYEYYFSGIWPVIFVTPILICCRTMSAEAQLAKSRGLPRIICILVSFKISGCINFN